MFSSGVSRFLLEFIWGCEPAFTEIILDNIPEMPRTIANRKNHTTALQHKETNILTYVSHNIKSSGVSRHLHSKYIEEHKKHCQFTTLRTDFFKILMYDSPSRNKLIADIDNENNKMSSKA